jgi:ABC-type polysaccharide/polyol phosphate transport system ATPase subunit
MIAGVLSPNEGNIALKGRVLGLFNLGVGFQDELTGRENIFLNGAILGASRSEIDKKFKDIVDFSELGGFIDMPLGSYSQGMRLRLGFSIVANLDFDILVIDEVLAVGDALFQSKCFERLMDFKRSGKTLVVTSQSMDLIERICDKAALLEHGRLLFCGEVSSAVNKYREVLNKERFIPALLAENTKKWADDISEWGVKLGTKEAVIETVEFINRFGIRCGRVKGGYPLRIKVSFTARNAIKEPHFGIAIFRKDGVYCHGPNTFFDSCCIKEIKPGRHVFELKYKKILLAPGEYRISVAIWDKNETLAFDYHNGCYKLEVRGLNNAGELLNMNFKAGGYIKGSGKHGFDLSFLNDKWENKSDIAGINLESVKLLNLSKEEKNVFLTNEPVELCVNFKDISAGSAEKCLWIGIYRDDKVYCQGIEVSLKKNNKVSVLFPELKLLPGGYRLSIGVWDSLSCRFLMFHHGTYSFKMVSRQFDHGTIYMDHKWKVEA